MSGTLEPDGVCRACGRRMCWARTQHGKTVPLDPRPSPEGTVEVNGTMQGPRGRIYDVIVLAGHHGGIRMAQARDLGWSLYTLHFNTCPKRAPGHQS